MSTQPTTPANRFLSIALPLAERGIKIVPVQPSEKRCDIPKWNTLATSDRDQIALWAGKYPEHNVGCVADDNLCVLDCDVAGLPERIERETGHTLPVTYTVISAGKRTPHLYYRHTERSRAFAQSAVSGGGFDFKVRASYVVGAGSSLSDGRTYDLAVDADFAPIPDWLVDWIRANAKSAPAKPRESRPVSEKFDVYKFLTHYGIDVREKGPWLIPDVCPIAKHRHEQSTETGFYFDGRSLGFKCFAATCKGSQMTIGDVIRHLNKGDGLKVVVPYSGEIWEKPEVEEAEVELPKDSVPRFECLRHDYIDQLAAEFSNGTIIPFNFQREVVKAALLAALPEDTRPRMAHFLEMHTRQYVILCSPHPESGKGEAVKRLTSAMRTDLGRADDAKGFVIGNNLETYGSLKFVQGETLGSPEYAVRKLGGANVGDVAGKADVGRYKHVVNYDEGSRLFQKDSEGAGGRGLGIMFTTLFESNRYSAGSIKNSEFEVEQANVSLLMSFTNDSFYRSLAGSGFVRDGLLSRCTLIADYKNRVAGDWAQIDAEKVKALLVKVRECLKRTELPEDADAGVSRREVLAKFAELDPLYSSRLSLLFQQDLYARALFSPEGRITRGAVERAAKWTEHQHLTRQVLWPTDVSKDKVENMTALLRAAYERWKQLTHTKAKKFANVRRHGSGGENVYMLAHRALLASGTIVEAGQNHKRLPVFAYADAD